MRRYTKATGAAAFICLLASCAHTSPKVTEMPSPALSRTPPPAPRPLSAPQVTAVPIAKPAVDPSAEIQAALRGTIVFFDFDRAELKADGMLALQRVAHVLREHPHFAVRIEGNCDERGTEEYNLMLGQRRAAVARSYLVALGVDPTELDTISYGELRPANPAHTEAAWAQNRRDELHPEQTKGS